MFRELNKFLTAVMERNYISWSGEFRQVFFIDRICGLSTVSENQKQLLELYIAVTYGDPEIRLVVPYALAKKHTLLWDEVRRAE